MSRAGCGTSLWYPDTVAALRMGPDGTFVSGGCFLIDGGVTAPTFTVSLPLSHRTPYFDLAPTAQRVQRLARAFRFSRI
ncbi:MAG: hypothetical protein CVU60_09670 [Deltaproteobacteria bacterium HGW-Deltaproteobacteria-18]|nr:MAG: hypothetical protein CVU60_09670 [Deltaproteobacteria bacterium HGW-Deltaproteobacteria-18]